MPHYRSHRRSDDIHQIVAGRQLEILAALGINWSQDRPKQHIRCPYPGHADANPSWRWDHDKGMAHCTCCHTNIFGVIERVRGCDWREARDYCREVLGAAAFKPNGSAGPDLRVVWDEPAKPKAPPPWERPVAATFDYVDEHGEELYQSVKFDDDLDPRFMQRHPDGLGGWKWGMEGIRRILYRLPELIASVNSGRTIYIVEGEKDVESLRALGLAATTNPMGAGKWRPEFSETLRNAEVVIIGDNDEPGRSHVAKITAALNGVAKCVRALDLAWCWPDCDEGGDISDWIAAGGTADKLSKMVALTPAPKPVHVADQPAAAADTWPIMNKAAFDGLAGEVVDTIAPHSEADPVAILLQFLTCAGNVIGRTAYYQVESDRHHANLFAVLVGASAKARKGTSAGRVTAIVKIADERWFDERMKGGLSSGEGLINEVRDEVKRWDAKAQAWETIDPGVTDKRLMVVETEFASALSVMERAGNTLSPLIRKAWDGGKLATITRTSPLCATASHISVVGHVTEDELRARITRTEMANGFANRFLFALIKRSKDLPFGGNLTDSEILRLGTELTKVVEFAKGVGRVTLTDGAKTKWAQVYSALSAGQPGLLGAITARAEAQAIRLAMVYALLDGKNEIDEPHLKAALAVWEYCEASAAHIFGNALGDPVADEILLALRQAGDGGMSRTEIRDLFGRHRSSDRIGAALALLMTRGRARAEVRTTGGRPSEVWSAAGGI